MAFQQLGVLNQQSREVIDRLSISTVESGFEPELFKSAFSAWLHFEQLSTTVVEEESDDEEEERKPAGKRAAELLPETIWIN